MKEEIRDGIYSNLDENIDYIKGLLKDVSDIVYREFYIGENKATLTYIDGMADKILINNFVLESLMLEKTSIRVEDIEKRFLTVSDMRNEKDLNKAVNSMMAGDTMLFIDNFTACYVISTRFWPARGVSEPSGETVVRGGRDGFTETIRFNTALVRRRIRDTRLKVIPKSLGSRSKTDTVIMYMEDIADKAIVDETMKRIERISIDSILDSGYVEQLIEDSKWSIFPQVQSTERPDVVASALYEGRVAVLVDNSPFVLIVPATLPVFFQSPDDYYQRWAYGSMFRIIRLIAVFMSLVLPALYVAVTSFHVSISPTKLAYFIAASREGVPFPAFVETIIMEVSLALLTESTIRLPKPIGSTIGIVGGLIIGQAAVSAGIVSPIMIIVISITTITNFTTPNYEVAMAIRIIRFLLIIAASFIGLYGIVLGLILLLIHLIRLKSFGISYLSPLVNPNIRDFKDVYIRLPWDSFKERPKYLNTKDKIRQK